MKENEVMKSRKIIFTTVLSALVCFGLTPVAKAVEPAAPATALAGGNTADGDNALLSLTTGFYNSAFGLDALLSISDQSFDTGIGAGALLLDTAGTNTAVGAGALILNSTGSANNAVGTFALFNNISGTFNNAHGRNCAAEQYPATKIMRWAMTPCLTTRRAPLTQRSVMTHSITT